MLRGVEWVHCLFLCPFVLGKMPHAEKLTSEKRNCSLFWKSNFKMALI